MNKHVAAANHAFIFIDEIDAIGSKRGFDLGGGAIQDSNKTLNQLLSETGWFWLNIKY